MRVVKLQLFKNCILQKLKIQQAYLELLNTNVAANAQLDITTLQMMDQHAVTFQQDEQI